MDNYLCLLIPDFFYLVFIIQLAIELRFIGS